MERIPMVAAAIMLIGGALLSAAIGMGPGGIFIMLFAGVAAIVAISVGQRAVEPAAQHSTPATVAPPPMLHDHPEFAPLFDALAFPLLIVRDGRVAAANRSALDLLGHFIIGADVRTAIRHPAAGDVLAVSGTNHFEQPVDLIGIGRAGQRWQMQVMPLLDHALLVALEDQSRHDAVERMRADFVANASHELRTPLAVILGTLETLHDPGANRDSAVRDKFLGNAEREARRMVRLVDDLLSISRIEASKGSRPNDAVDIVALCHSVAAELTATGLSDGQAIDVQRDDPVLVQADRAQLSQLVHNLVSNALKYGGERAPVVITVRDTAGAMAELTVSDSGEGIPAEHLPRLTERFYRVDSARSRAKGGTGLGLAIAKHIVQRHQGRMEIDSVVGSGTCVRVHLPLATATTV